MKNIFFQFLKRKESHHQWKHDYLSLLYVEGLEYVINCLANMGITRYFIDTLNILGDSSYVQKAWQFFEIVSALWFRIVDLDCEGWHQRLNRKAQRSNLNLYRMIDFLYAESQMVQVKVVIMSDRKIRSIQKKSKTTEARIQTYWEEFLSGHRTVRSLLHSCASVDDPINWEDSTYRNWLFTDSMRLSPSTVSDLMLVCRALYYIKNTITVNCVWSRCCWVITWSWMFRPRKSH